MEREKERDRDREKNSQDGSSHRYTGRGQTAVGSNLRRGNGFGPGRSHYSGPPLGHGHGHGRGAGGGGGRQGYDADFDRGESSRANLAPHQKLFDASIGNKFVASSSAAAPVGPRTSTSIPPQRVSTPDVTQNEDNKPEENAHPAVIKPGMIDTGIGLANLSVTTNSNNNHRRNGKLEREALQERLNGFDHHRDSNSNRRSSGNDERHGRATSGGRNRAADAEQKWAAGNGEGDRGRDGLGWDGERERDGVRSRAQDRYRERDRTRDNIPDGRRDMDRGMDRYRDHERGVRIKDNVATGSLQSPLHSEPTYHGQPVYPHQDHFPPLHSRPPPPPHRHGFGPPPPFVPPPPFGPYDGRGMPPPPGHPSEMFPPLSRSGVPTRTYSPRSHSPRFRHPPPPPPRPTSPPQDTVNYRYYLPGTLGPHESLSQRASQRTESDRSFQGNHSSRYLSQVSGDNGASKSSTAGPRQLFDPQRHDPNYFALHRGERHDANAGDASFSDAHSIRTHTSASRSVSGTSVASTDYKNNRWKGKGHLLDCDETDSTTSGGSVLVDNLRAIYREITRLEARLQDENHSAEEALLSLCEEKVEKDSDGDSPEQCDDAYWVRLSHSHRT